MQEKMKDYKWLVPEGIVVAAVMMAFTGLFYELFAVRLISRHEAMTDEARAWPAFEGMAAHGLFVFAASAKITGFCPFRSRRVNPLTIGVTAMTNKQWIYCHSGLFILKNCLIVRNLFHLE